MNTPGAGGRNASFVLLPVATLAIGLDVGVARTTYGVALPAFARDLQLSLTTGESVAFKKIAGFLVAACSASIGVNPASTSKASSSWRLKPGKQYGFKTSVPARIGTPAGWSNPSGRARAGRLFSLIRR